MASHCPLQRLRVAAERMQDRGPSSDVREIGNPPRQPLWWTAWARHNGFDPPLGEDCEGCMVKQQGGIGIVPGCQGCLPQYCC